MLVQKPVWQHRTLSELLRVCQRWWGRPIAVSAWLKCHTLHIMYRIIWKHSRTTHVRVTVHSGHIRFPILHRITWEYSRSICFNMTLHSGNIRLPIPYRIRREHSQSTHFRVTSQGGHIRLLCGVTGWLVVFFSKAPFPCFGFLASSSVSRGSSSSEICHSRAVRSASNRRSSSFICISCFNFRAECSLFSSAILLFFLH